LHCKQPLTGASAGFAVGAQPCMPAAAFSDLRHPQPALPEIRRSTRILN